MGDLLDRMRASCPGQGQLQKVGEFEVRSGTLFISDPSYEMDRKELDGQEIVEKAGDGIWIFYGACCDCTLSREHAGVIPSGGVTKCRGGDDGIYSGRIYRYKEQAVAVMLEFAKH